MAAEKDKKGTVRDRIVAAWEGRPEWLQGPVVLGLSASLAALLISFGVALVYLSPDRPGQKLRLDQFTGLVEESRVTSVEFRDEDAIAVGRLAAGGGVAGDRLPAKGGEFHVAYPQSGVILERLITEAQKSGARVSTDQQSFKAAVRIVTTFLLPLMILANLFALAFLLMRSGGGAMTEIETFGTLGKGRKGQSAASMVTFKDVAGAGEAVEELQEVVDYLRDPSRYAAVGAVPPKGVLLFGPPGCGKTLIARAVAGEAGVPFFSVAGAEFVESLVGVGAARVRDLFAKVREVAPAIVFIDEMDAAARRRGGAGGGGGGSDEREQTLNQLLVEIDGFDVQSGLVVIGATNRPDILDPAVLRPGRFDRHVTVDQPDHQGRVDILRLHARKKPIAADVDFETLARHTPGFTGADLANVINEAALLTVRGSRREIENDLLTEAVQRVLHGPQRRGRVLSPAERERAAVHESGHAIVAAAVGRGEDIHRLSILSRGRGLGLTAVRLDSDAVLFTRDDLFAQLTVSFGGVAAEELALGQGSTGAEQDFEHATWLAREIAGRYGMSERLGRVRLLAHDADEYLGATLGLQAMSERTHEQFDEEVKHLLEEAESHARDIVEGNRPVLDTMVATLLERETLEGEPLQKLLTPVSLPERNGKVAAKKR